MAKSPPPPELVQAYRLIKEGKRRDAGPLLKAYLETNRDDPRAWWLLSHVVQKPETVRRCLEMTLKYDPTHEKARARLARLTQVPDDEPDDSFFTNVGAPSAEATAPETFVRTETAPIEATDPTDPPPFEVYAAQTSPGIDPFTGQPVNNPFVGIMIDDEPEAADEDEPPGGGPFTGTTGGGSYDPFDSSNIFDPSAHASLGAEPSGKAQAPGTGNQPAWGPGLAYVEEPVVDGAEAFPGAESPPATPVTGRAAAFADERQQARRAILYGLGVAVVFILLGGLLVMGSRQGWFDADGGAAPAMTTLDGASFTVDYPEGWDSRCEREALGYPVCGIANHKLYNEVDFFAGTDIDLGEMLSESLGMALTGGDLPETQMSIIVMDVPRHSPAYDDASWAKTKYEWYQRGYDFNEGAEVTYDRQQIDVDGHVAYYYEYTSSGTWTEAAWDVYVEHDGLILWMRIDFTGPRHRDIPQATVDAMIRSLRLASTS